MTAPEDTGSEMPRPVLWRAPEGGDSGPTRQARAPDGTGRGSVTRAPDGAAGPSATGLPTGGPSAGGRARPTRPPLPPGPPVGVPCPQTPGDAPAAEAASPRPPIIRQY